MAPPMPMPKPRSSSLIKAAEPTVANYIENTKKDAKGNLVTKRYARGNLLGKGGFAKCYQVSGKSKSALHVFWVLGLKIRKYNFTYRDVLHTIHPLKSQYREHENAGVIILAIYVVLNAFLKSSACKHAQCPLTTASKRHKHIIPAHTVMQNRRNFVNVEWCLLFF
jgi:hypothetical protein